MCKLRRSQGLCASFVVVATLTLAMGLARGQAISSAPAPQTVTDVLQTMSSRAGIIFAGQVLAVRSLSGTPGIVEVDFRVDTAIRGCTVGTYTLREWAGLWAGGEQRYRVGQALLMLLHTRGAAGLSSPIDGLNGAIPIRQGGSSTPYTGTAPPVRIVDLRWLGAKLPRPVSYRSVAQANAMHMLPPIPFVATPETMVKLRSGATGNVTVISPVSGDAANGSVPAQQASVGAVVAMLTAWEAARHAAP
jgi:hypothetical protein